MRIVEATLIMPLTILITAALITLMMSFYTELGKQIEAHDAKRADWKKVSAALTVRAYDRAKDALSAGAE